jgi:hypothetical protein
MYPSSTCAYYIRRLWYIRSTWDIVDPQRKFFVRYEDLLSRPDDTLDKLGKWLELDTPIPTTYNTKFTKRQDFVGDRSKNIHTGKLIPKTTFTPKELTGLTEQQQCLPKIAKTTYERLIEHISKTQPL